MSTASSGRCRRAEVDPAAVVCRPSLLVYQAIRVRACVLILLLFVASQLYESHADTSLERHSALKGAWYS